MTSALKALMSIIIIPLKNNTMRLYSRSMKATGQEPLSCSGWVFNSKLVSYSGLHCIIMECQQLIGNLAQVKSWLLTFVHVSGKNAETPFAVSTTDVMKFLKNPVQLNFARKLSKNLHPLLYTVSGIKGPQDHHNKTFQD